LYWLQLSIIDAGVGGLGIPRAVDHSKGQVNGYKGDKKYYKNKNWKYGNKYHYKNKYKYSDRYWHGGRYWGHRYNYRPYGWQTLGCVAVGPLWYCP
jgi:hypothetical protein